MIDADTIKQLLAVKHSKDVFVPECKDGPSMGGMRMMDAWAMKRSWSRPCYYGYEIKVSRADFLQDTKWHEYLDLCNEFYFVCPHGVIKPDELSKDVGLLVVAKTGTRLFTKKRAPHRILDNAPENLLIYILMARCRITSSTYYAPSETPHEYWKQWLEEKDSKLELGTRCSRKLRKSFEEQVYNVTRDMRWQESEIKKLQEVKDLLKELGIDPSEWNLTDKVRRAMTVEEAIPPRIRNTCERLNEQLTELLSQKKK